MLALHINYVRHHGHYCRLLSDGSILIGIPVTDRGICSTELHVCRTCSEIKLALGY